MGFDPHIHRAAREVVEEREQASALDRRTPDSSLMSSSMLNPLLWEEEKERGEVLELKHFQIIQLKLESQS